MRELGQWNDAWNPFFDLDPIWTDEFMATGAGIYGSGLLSSKFVELISIAFDASYTHMYAPGTRRHIKAALKAGASVEEIMEVLKLCVVQGVQACNLGVPILAEELKEFRAIEIMLRTPATVAQETRIGDRCGRWVAAGRGFSGWVVG